MTSINAFGGFTRVLKKTFYHAKNTVKPVLQTVASFQPLVRSILQPFKEIPVVAGVSSTLSAASRAIEIGANIGVGIIDTIDNAIKDPIADPIIPDSVSVVSAAAPVATLYTPIPLNTDVSGIRLEAGAHGNDFVDRTSQPVNIKGAPRLRLKRKAMDSVKAFA